MKTLLEEAAIRYPIGTIISNENLGFGCKDVHILLSEFSLDVNNNIISTGFYNKNSGTYSVYADGEWAEITGFDQPLYRFKTKEEFIEDGLWSNVEKCPYNWSKKMLRYLDEAISNTHLDSIENGAGNFKTHDCQWNIARQDYVLIDETKELEKTNNELERIKQELFKPLIIKKEKTMKTQAKTTSNLREKFVYMDKTISLLEIGLVTGKNIVLHGPGGHGKSDITLEFLKEKGIDPYIITMGTGMTTERLFGGMDIKQYDNTGRLEYLVDNSFMNHEYVIFEEMFDAPDFILEQLKDILSSGTFRNGTQRFDIKTKYIICCTNRTRDEFSKNMSLKALMERFPLELNVVWDNYTEISYNKLLESKFGEGNVDPIIPFLLQEYAKSGITISPRIAVVAYQVFDQCGPDSLTFIAEFAKKPELIADAIKKFEATIKFRELSQDIYEKINDLEINTLDNSSRKSIFEKDLDELNNKFRSIKILTVSDDNAHTLASLIKVVNDKIKIFEKKQSVAKILVEL